MRDELPPEWKELASSAGVRPSFTGISEVTGLAISTIKRVVSGGKNLSETYVTMADKLGVSVEKIRSMAGVGGKRVWIPTEAAQSLPAGIQEALDDLIRAIAREGGSSASTGGPPKKSPGSPETGTQPVDIQGILRQSRGGHLRAAADRGGLIDEQEEDGEPDDFNQDSGE